MPFGLGRRRKPPQPPAADTRPKLPREKRIHEPCKAINPLGVWTYPRREGQPVRFYPHSPCDSDTVVIRREDFPPRPSD